MLDIGMGELLVIGTVALIVVGPKDLPGLFRTVGQVTGKARSMAREFQRSLEQAANESGANEISSSLKGFDRLNLNSATNSARKYAEGLVSEQKSAAAAKPPTAAKPAAQAEPASATEPAKPAAEPAGPATGASDPPAS